VILLKQAVSFGISLFIGDFGFLMAKKGNGIGLVF
jgi:hypothetical protein